MPPLLAAALIVFLEGFSFGIGLPVLPNFARDLGGGVDWAGVLFALSTLPRIVFGPLWGRLSDRLGRRWTLAILTVGTTLASLLWSYAGHDQPAAMSGLMWLLASRAVYGVFASQSVLSLAVASDVSTPEKRAAAMGVVGAAFGIAFTVGPALGGWFAQSYGEASIGYLAAAGQIASLAVILAVLKETHPQHGPSRADVEVFAAPTSLMRLVSHPAVMLLMLVTCLATVAYSVMLPTYEPLAHAWYGWKLDQVGYALATFGLVGALVQGGMIRPMVKRLGVAPTAILGLIVAAIGLLWIASHPGTGGFWAGTVLLALGTGLSNPAITTLMSLSVGEQDQGAVHGLNYSATSLGRGAGYLLAGYVYVQISPGATYVIGGAAALLAALLVLLVLPMLARRKAA